MGNQFENRVNLQNFQLTYQATPCWSFGFNPPLLFASRRSRNAFNTFHTHGFGDLIVTAQTWILGPSKPHHGNVQVGYGLLIPTGSDKVENTYLASASATSTTTRPVDYSIQPGAGGWGIALQGQAFRLFSKKEIHANARYIITRRPNRATSEIPPPPRKIR